MLARYRRCNYIKVVSKYQLLESYIIDCKVSEAYSGSCHISKMERKRFILDVWLGSEYPSEYRKRFPLAFFAKCNLEQTCLQRNETL